MNQILFKWINSSHNNRSSHVCHSTWISVSIWRSTRAELTVEGDAEQLWQIREAAIVLQVFINQSPGVLQRFNKCSSGAAGSGAGRHGWATADTFADTARQGGQFYWIKKDKPFFIYIFFSKRNLLKYAKAILSLRNTPVTRVSEDGLYS